jgi:tripartite-type tricarboxylate transporter receptor subunit TctC
MTTEPRQARLHRVTVHAALVAMLTGFVQLAWAQDWPTRPVRLIVSQAPGGTPDIVARIVNERLSRVIQQPVVVENYAGQANVAGALAAARSPADGHTFFLGSTAAMVTNRFTFKSLPYDPERDFTPVAMVGKVAFVILANPQLPAGSLDELIALAKSRPGALNIATEGQRNFTGMVVSWLNMLAGISIVQVPYRSQPQGIQDALAGRTQMVVLAIPAAIPFLERGALKPIATSALARLPGLETVPAMAESLPGFDFGGWFALFAPSATPAGPILAANRAMREIIDDAAVIARLRQLGLFTQGAGSAQELGEFVESERVKWRRLVAEIGIEPH